jgi:hypothetical protein
MEVTRKCPLVSLEWFEEGKGLSDWESLKVAVDGFQEYDKGYNLASARG